VLLLEILEPLLQVIDLGRLGILLLLLLFLVLACLLGRGLLALYLWLLSILLYTKPSILGIG
jgi:hypothetical protein